jgi:hypothetical protein
MKTPLLTLTIICLIYCTGCDSNPEISRTVDKVKNSLSEITGENQKIASKEVEKLFIYEYQVLDLPLTASADVIQANLSNLGKERWNCFQIDRNKTNINIICKRRPKSYLRYVTNIF